MDAVGLATQEKFPLQGPVYPSYMQDKKAIVVETFSHRTQSPVYSS